MKRKIVLIFTAVLVVSAAGVLVYANRLPRRAQASPEAIPVRAQFAANRQRIADFSAEARIEATRIVNVSFAVGGKLEQGVLFPEAGTTFKQGQLLFQINNREAFAAMSRAKAHLSALLLDLLPEIGTQFPAEKNKWIRFMEELKPQFLLPELPPFRSSNERYLVTAKGILTEFYALQQAEAKMADYFYLAPFDGTILSVAKYPGSVAAAHQAVAQIGVEGPFHISSYGSNEAVFGNKGTVYVCLPGNDTIGKAAFLLRRSFKTAPAQLCYRFEPDRRRRLAHGMPVVLKTTAQHPLKSTKMPASALDRDLVQLIRSGKIQTRRISIVGRKDDSVFVSGLADGEAYLTEYRHRNDPAARYAVRSAE